MSTHATTDLPSVAAPPGQSVKIVAFGDSITALRPGAVKEVYSQRMATMLANLGRKVEVLNAGVPGQTTTDARERFHRDALSREPQIIILQFGGNDSFVRIFERPPQTRPRVELTTFAVNLSDMIRWAKSRGVYVICVGTPPFRWAPRTRELYGGPPYRPDDAEGLFLITARYNSQARSVSETEGVPFVDLDHAFRCQSDPLETFLLDGLHPNDLGHQVIAELVTAEVSRILAGANADRRRNTPQRVWVHRGCTWLHTHLQGPFVALDGKAIFTANHRSGFASTDDAKSWTEVALFAPDQPHVLAQERVLTRTTRGTLVVAFVDNATRHWEWDRERREASPDVKADVYSVRSTDGGTTWETPVLVQGGYCGAVRRLVCVQSGALVLTAQDLSRNPSRHVSYVYTSTDDGRSWTRSAPLDLGGHGHHDGSLEGTVVQLRDGRLWILLRTAFGFFYQAFSADDGLTWRDFAPTAIDASSAPADIIRLHSGRLCLAWNRRFRVDERASDATDSHAAIVAPSWQRQELSVALSDDDGASWSSPIVIARNEAGQRVCYPFLFERRPGEVWITAMQGYLRVSIMEQELLR